MNFEAVLIDQKDGTELTLNDEEFQVLALPLVPLVVAFIAKQGLKAAIKKYGKTTLTKLLKDNESVAKAVSKELGYNEVKGQYSHGAKIYQRGKGKGPKFTFFTWPSLWKINLTRLVNNNISNNKFPSRHLFNPL